MTRPAIIHRVQLRNYKSIGHCDVNLRELTCLVGRNGSGKSNFLDALHFVRDALVESLDSALNARGGLTEVCRRSSDSFGIRIEFLRANGEPAHYAFEVGSGAGNRYEVLAEECQIGNATTGPFFRVEKGSLQKSSEPTFPSVTADRLALVAVSGLTAFRPLYDALTGMCFYNFDPKLMRELQKPHGELLLKPTGENIARVLGQMENFGAERLRIIQEYLQSVVPMVHGVKPKVVGHMETLEFCQHMDASESPSYFSAQNMSDGTLRALGVLTALFQDDGIFRAPTLIGIEEPETALHPGASAALREALTKASEHTQVIITSHSPELLDDTGIDADSILAVESQKGATRIAPLDEAGRTMLHEHLFSVGELLRMDQLAPDPEILARQDASRADLLDKAAE
jgi:predicted ATPase